ncbi:MAG: Holliday junction resolvase RuvX [Candidatus Pacebacteria bacterium]|nr:Holliday junction resolvase RuvX [Candidatus Paceibacterota bacterium]MBP9772275.1 Holliday junction resolvase RuvX [Candidatus Paceibacterota bacterium]QQR76878.1 MAG: Holliday junction resolvase RuvX [Candidatus Nomurabacteria bacterium]
MKILGVDFGTKRIGLALSDDGGSLAFPESIILNDKNAFNNIRNIIEGREVSEIVVGLPTDTGGEDTTATAQAKKFADDLQVEFNLPTHMMDERFSSFSVFSENTGKENLNARKQKMIRPVDVDAQAAAIILQRYLDSRNIKI